MTYNKINEYRLMKELGSNQKNRTLMSIVNDNDFNFTDRQKLMLMAYEIGKQPNALNLYREMNFISREQYDKLQERNLYDGMTVFQSIMMEMDVQTSEKGLEYQYVTNSRVFTSYEIDGMMRYLSDVIPENERELSLDDKYVIYMTALSENGNAKEILYESGFLSPEQADIASKNRWSSVGITSTLIANRIVTPNSAELSIKFFGYNRPITPELLDVLIDQVETRDRLIVERAHVYGNSLDDIELDVVQEDELAVEELTEGLA